MLVNAHQVNGPPGMGLACSIPRARACFNLSDLLPSPFVTGSARPVASECSYQADAPLASRLATNFVDQTSHRLLRRV